MEANMSSIGTPSYPGTDKSLLTKKITVFTQSNSELPWDMNRAITTDKNNNIWIGTDNGIVQISNGKWIVYNTENEIFDTYPSGVIRPIKNAFVDSDNNVWLTMGGSLYQYENFKWKRFDENNSILKSARFIYEDSKNNIWVTSWDGLYKFDGKKWTVINQENSGIPSNKTFGFHIDKNDKILLGTLSGNVIIENNIVHKIDDQDSPLSSSIIFKAIEDKNGNIWFSLYNEHNYKNKGIYILDKSSNWTKIDFPLDNEILKENGLNDFLLDEENNELWVSLSGVGILLYHLDTKNWEIYTNQNSNFPSIYAEQITKDKLGNIWVSTFAGVAKIENK